MRFIGKSSKETVSSRNSARLTVYTINVYLTKSALDQFDIRNGDKIKFMASEGFFAFYKSNDRDAYSIYVPNPNKGGVIHSRGLSKFFRDEFKRPTGTLSFRLSPTRSEVAGAAVVEIKTNVIYTGK